MYAPIAERAIPYEQYMSRDADHIYSASRVTPRNAPAASRATSDDAAAQEMRQFSREPTVISLLSTVDDDVKTATPAAGSGSRSSAVDRTRPVGSGGEGATITAGFDSNTLKRMLQTLPELSTPVDLMQEFEEEFADVVGASTGSVAARDDVKPPPPPLAMPSPPATNDDHPVTTITAASTASDRPTDATHAADTNTLSAEIITTSVSDVNEEKTSTEDHRAELSNGEHAVVTTQLADVALTTVTTSGKCHALHLPLLVTNGLYGSSTQEHFTHSSC